MQQMDPDRVIVASGGLRTAVAIGRTCAATAALGVVLVAIVGVADRPPATTHAAVGSAAADGSVQVPASAAKVADVTVTTVAAVAAVATDIAPRSRRRP